MNAGTIVVLTILFAIVVLIIRNMVKQKCAGKSPLCNCGCSSCGCHCNEAHDKKA